ncbi:hypothetical protein [Paenibacillus lautus]|uniref:Uncharacterized protein n=1 Tax=Paenibacillus lautus TaxID=1401 RepID=A0A385TT23_PAELA|nr:hypothetical protein [Paenibacillus lautus]AYB46268.1 hypothetical protein D5F53_24535 [Paenibacillus lautus]
MKDKRYEQVVDAYLALPNHSERVNPVWHRMLRRVAEGVTAILPIRDGRDIRWIVLQSDRRLLDEHILELEAYLQGYCEPFFRDIRYFKSNGAIFSEACKTLYTDGYYSFSSGEGMEEPIAAMLHLWIELDSRRPVIREVEVEVSSFTLRSKFHAFIATSQWQEAKDVLEIIRQGRYVNDENYQFLKIQWLSSQNKWGDLYHSADFVSVSQLEHVPTKIKEYLLLAYYDRELAELDTVHDFEQGVKQYEKTRYRIISVLNKTVFQDHIPHLRLMAYEASHREDWALLESLQSKSNDDTSSQLIARFLEKRKFEEDVPIEERIGTYITERRYSEAFEWLYNLETSPLVMKYAAKIACMTESDEAFIHANARWDVLTDKEQESLLQDPNCKSDLKLVLAWSRDKQIQPDTESPSIITWNFWFDKFLQPATKGEDLDKWLRMMESEQTGIAWNDTALEQLSDFMMSAAVENISGKQRSILESAFPILCSEIVTRKGFPDNRAEHVYTYLMELMAEHAKRNQTNSSFWLQLTEGLLTLDVSKVDVQWTKTFAWFDKIDASKIMLPTLLSALELFLDFGGPIDEISGLWMKWTGALGNSIVTLERDIVSGWIDLGRQMNVSTDWFQNIGLDSDEDINSDKWHKIEKCQVAIFTLREAAARRAVERLKPRNPLIKYMVVTVESLTAEAKAHAKHADIVVIVTACLSHALFYGIQPFVKDKTAYPRSSGSTGIVQAIEDYIENFYL